MFFFIICRFPKMRETPKLLILNWILGYAHFRI